MVGLILILNRGQFVLCCCYCSSVCQQNDSETYGWILMKFTFGALMRLVGRQEGHLACKKTEWWGAGVVICLERGADLHMVQLMPLPLTISCFSIICIGFTFLIRLTRMFHRLEFMD